MINYVHNLCIFNYYTCMKNQWLCIDKESRDIKMIQREI